MRTHHTPTSVSSWYSMCPHTTIFELYVSSYHYIHTCVLILLYLNPLSLPADVRYTASAHDHAVQDRVAPVYTIYILYMCPHTMYYTCVLIRSCLIRSCGASRRGTGGRGISGPPTPSASPCCAPFCAKTSLLPPFAPACPPPPPAAEAEEKKEEEECCASPTGKWASFGRWLNLLVDVSAGSDVALQDKVYYYTLLYMYTLLYLCPHTTMYVSACYYMCVVILLCMCPHTTIHVSSYCYICVLILLYMCSAKRYLCVLLTKTYVCRHTTVYVCPHATVLFAGAAEALYVFNVMFRGDAHRHAGLLGHEFASALQASSSS